MSARDFALKLHTQSGSNAYFVDICNNRPRDVFLPKHQHRTLSQESTNELFSSAAIIGGVAAAHTAHISRPWVDNFGKFVHEATNKHHPYGNNSSFSGSNSMHSSSFDLKYDVRSFHCALSEMSTLAPGFDVKHERIFSPS